jgi:CubicO group peptidase (beta-lactamase class C family)
MRAGVQGRRLKTIA